MQVLHTAGNEVLAAFLFLDQAQQLPALFGATLTVFEVLSTPDVGICLCPYVWVAHEFSLPRTDSDVEVDCKFSPWAERTKSGT